MRYNKGTESRFGQDLENHSFVPLTSPKKPAKNALQKLRNQQLETLNLAGKVRLSGFLGTSVLVLQNQCTPKAA
jgi:hypothetical protein